MPLFVQFLLLEFDHRRFKIGFAEHTPSSLVTSLSVVVAP
jgi:hypothetical protein